MQPTPRSYQIRIANLRRRVLQLEAQLGMKGSPVVGARPATLAESLHHRCGECGAEVGLQCRSPGDRSRNPHHVRGRTQPCGKSSCETCATYFEEQSRAAT